MPGAFAHITLVNELKEPRRLEAIAGFPVEAITAVLDFFKFCELGAVSPDYPYLTVGDGNAAVWADLMHYTKTGDMLKAGISAVSQLQGDNKRKAFAWLLGYAAHVATDVTIHPVVELKVGPYAQNKKDHRVCEMHQDAYIFQRLNLGQIGLSEHLDSGIWGCCQVNTDQLDAAVAQVWLQMLKEVHPDAFSSNLPDVNIWHQKFKKMVDKIAEEGDKLLPISRHIALDCGLTYPKLKQVQKQYIKSLKVPFGSMDYDDIFDKAIGSVAQVWGLVAKGVFANDNAYQTQIGNWNLDTGKDEAGNYAFWSQTA
ncbi:MAG: zinc dependent phospholipase C family protein [Methylotenera sp.]